MDNGQYSIPDYGREVDSGLGDNLDRLASDIDAFENKLKYETYKEIERNIETMRESASADILPNPGFAGSILNQIMEPRPLAERLLDAESKIGGNLIPKAQNVLRQRFFFYNGYWYLEIIDSEGAMVASYQLIDGLAFKFVAGKQIDFEPNGELENLLSLIPIYEKAVKEQLYKRDFDLTA